jgi:hypothetical protein
MEKSGIRPRRLVMELSQLFNLETSLDTVLVVSMYKLNQYMDSDDLEMLDMTARLVAAALNKKRGDDALLTINITCEKLGNRLSTELALSA